MSLAGYCTTIRDALIAANIRATTDPNQVTPPCVLIVPQEGEMTTLDGATSKTAMVMHLIGPGFGGRNSMDALSSLFSQVIAANVAPVTRWRLTSYDTDGGDSMPTFDLEWIASVDVVAP